LADPAIGLVYAANISGLGATHSDEELVLAIRHGLDQDGRQLMIMPSESFINFSAEDLGATIAYLKTVPRVENELPGPDLTFMGKIMLAAGLFGSIFPAEYIDHSQPFPAMPEVGASMEYGAYISGFCAGCHGPDLAGGPAGDPDSPPAPSLRGDGELNSWSEEEFLQVMRTGITPDGDRLDPEAMPWESFGKFDDDELKGLWLHLRSLPPAG
jgi:mono/diheme cytochrome c family protein